jgi:phospholipid/cholesterol/gamma-HCH transport system substrate-binding protein
MRSTGNRSAVIVGIFIFLALAIFIWTVLTLGSQKKTFANSITIKSYFENVNGLQKGNNVWFSGVKVGTIKKVNLIGNGRVEVDMNIEENSLPFIRKNAKARLSTDGLIGNKIVEIYGGTSKAPQIANGDMLNNDKLLSTDEMMNTLAKNNDNLLAITANFKNLSSNLLAGKGSIGKLLTDETFANKLDNTVIILNKTTANLEKLTANVSDYTAKLNEKGGLANDLVTDTVIFAHLRATVSQLQNVADQSKQIMGNLDSATNNLNEGLNNKNAPAGMFLHDEKTATGLKNTLQNLQAASKKLDEDLEAAQHNFLLRGFFKKKAKNDKENGRVVLDTTVMR